MLGNIVSALISGGVSLIAALFSFLPEIDMAALPLVPPQEVSDVLGFFNWFVPVADLLTIFALWVAAVLAINILLPLLRLVDGAKGGK